MELILIRHGCTQSNLERRYLGRSDEPLCSLGRQQAEALRRTGLPIPNALFVSPLARCIQTAKIVFPNVSRVVVPQFIELDFGEFEGHTHEKLMALDSYAQWLQTGGESPVPKGETRSALCARVRRGFLETVVPCACERAALVVHSGTIMALLSEFSPRAFYECYVANGGWVLCSWDGAAITVKGGALS
ncbi:MAG: histidine phosphatase family protein [Pyramidobacter sp.]|nr:histidine phosphatase family protein [Pyramidobacter sp.]